MRWPLPKDNWQLAERAYEIGREKGLGLKLEVSCWLDQTPCCYVLIPDDEAAAESLMMTELRFSYPTDPRLKAIKVRFRCLWKLLVKRTPTQAAEDWLGILPSRKQITEVTG